MLKKFFIVLLSMAIFLPIQSYSHEDNLEDLGGKYSADFVSFEEVETIKAIDLAIEINKIKKKRRQK